MQTIESVAYCAECTAELQTLAPLFIRIQTSFKRRRRGEREQENGKKTTPTVQLSKVQSIVYMNMNIRSQFSSPKVFRWW